MVQIKDEYDFIVYDNFVLGETFFFSVLHVLKKKIALGTGHWIYMYVNLSNSPKTASAWSETL